MTTQPRIARVVHATTAEGPGLRTAIWVQGCSIRCSGCINPHLFSPTGGEIMPKEQIIEDAVAAGVEGLTLLGGEPFDQAGPLAGLASLAQARGMGVITFTGYEFDDLASRDHYAQSLLANTDLLVDGPYQAEIPEQKRALVGSTNQRFIHLTDRYADYDPESNPNRLHVRIGPDGTADVAGFLNSEALKSLLNGTGLKRVRRRSSQSH
ncbi:radical SAM protein (plasmid) [Arthrobacter sp. TES]|uniref:4Fe-4S single cluster domain-containing protein n=1 Tax=Paenarthrobacter TaxID=1742992 RepID=UPI0004CF8201|nr:MULTISPECIES: 4Fe-4S single cluster domain-containing protein [Paenarthrobacter]KII26603.1 ribonucleoside-triphosphate reductase [Arthrobacter sp. AK-YN10]QOI65915.1 radical SAM protein [Arthrobacter sp. TES]WOC63327.1 4Fe-4S single cluster domain-containing protein [Paenarthrobacter sp. AT5]